MQLGMLGQELCHPLGLMRREVVGDNMDLPAFGFQRNDLAEKGHKLFGGMVGGGLTRTSCDERSPRQPLFQLVNQAGGF